MKNLIKKLTLKYEFLHKLFVKVDCTNVRTIKYEFHPMFDSTMYVATVRETLFGVVTEYELYNEYEHHSWGWSDKFANRAQVHVRRAIEEFRSARLEKEAAEMYSKNVECAIEAEREQMK